MERLDVEMPPAELKKRLDAGTSPRLIDVRQQSEAQICALPGSELIPLNEIPARLDELSKDEEIVLYCHHGMRSLNAAVFLRDERRGATSGEDGTIRIWDLESGRELDRIDLATSTDFAYSLAVSPDGQYLVAGTGRGMNLVFELTGE